MKIEIEETTNRYFGLYYNPPGLVISFGNKHIVIYPGNEGYINWDSKDREVEKDAD